MLARTRNLVFEREPSRRAIITFADTTMDHDGTIYKASGFDFVSEVPEDYHYRHIETGRYMHKRTLWGHAKKMGVSEKEYMEIFGFIPEWGAKKLKFIYFKRD